MIQMPCDMRWRDWRSLLRIGDYFTLALALCFCLAVSWHMWRGGAPDEISVRVAGQEVLRRGLSQAQIVEVEGVLGTTRIEVQPGRVRVISDPGPRQYCVQQGWLSQAGAVAICAPNQVSLHLLGGETEYDGLNY